jgi:hypothetical protein
MLSGQHRVAFARIPAQDVLFSVVEEERGRDCGKIQSLLLTVRGASLGVGNGTSRVEAGIPSQGSPNYFQLS